MPTPESERVMAWQRANPDKVKATKARFKKRHPEKNAEYKRKHKARKESNEFD